jgi:hypothetical protein
MDFTNPLVYGVPCFFGFIAIELYSKAFDDKQLYKWKDLVSSFPWYRICSSRCASKTVAVILVLM